MNASSTTAERRQPLSVAVLISGRGSNFRALHQAADRIGIRIPVVISNRPDAEGLKYAQTAGVPACCIDRRKYSRSAFDQALQAKLDSLQPELLVLAGFMHILGDAFVADWSARMINIHPSLLPKYPGLNTHRNVLANGDSEHGASVHFVTAKLDGGPVISQCRIPVMPEDSPQSLARRLLPEEHRLLVRTVELFAGRRVELRDNLICLDERLLNDALQLDQDL